MRVRLVCDTLVCDTLVCDARLQCVQLLRELYAPV